jgi:hypothetical protein
MLFKILSDYSEIEFSVLSFRFTDANYRHVKMDVNVNLHGLKHEWDELNFRLMRKQPC